jgi:hypothetical protein
LSLAVGVFSSASFAAAPASAGTAPLVPRATSTGFSTIEQRYVYAPPDKGRLEMPLSLGLGAPKELFIEEPVMCGAQAQAALAIDYDKAANTVKVTADFHKSLPYRPSLTRPFDSSTMYNQFPVSVQNGNWQFWFVTRQFSFETNFYYDAATLQLIGNEKEFPAGQPANSIAIKVPTLAMMGLPAFEGRPDGDGHFETTLRYDALLDSLGTAGIIMAFLPYNLCKPDEYGPYYITQGLPAAQAINFDTVLQGIWDGYGIAMSMSYEPNPKPAYLGSRDNTMIGWTGAYPGSIPKGYAINPVRGTLELAGPCQTHVAPVFPKAFYNLCGI